MHKMKEKIINCFTIIVIVVLILSVIIDACILYPIMFHTVTEYGWKVLFSPESKFDIIGIAWESSILFRITHVAFHVSAISAVLTIGYVNTSE